MKPSLHNVGYTDLKCGYGYIFNGISWIKKEIGSIMNDLLNSKRKDLLKIYEEIKDFLNDEENKNIENRLNDIHHEVEPKFEHHVRSKKQLVTNLKTRFYNNRHLVSDAIKKSGKPIIDTITHSKTKNILRHGYTEQIIDDLIKLKKNSALDLLNRIRDDITKEEYHLLATRIHKINNIKILNTIIHLLNKSFCFADPINDTILTNKINNLPKEEAFLKKIFCD